MGIGGSLVEQVTAGTDDAYDGAWGKTWKRV